MLRNIFNKKHQAMIQNIWLWMCEMVQRTVSRWLFHQMKTTLLEINKQGQFLIKLNWSLREHFFVVTISNSGCINSASVPLEQELIREILF